jgi:hypothetical protein
VVINLFLAQFDGADGFLYGADGFLFRSTTNNPG